MIKELLFEPRLPPPACTVDCNKFRPKRQLVYSMSDNSFERSHFHLNRLFVRSSCMGSNYLWSIG